jgi:cytochrome c oxidase cbb3-type subunit III
MAEVKKSAATEKEKIIHEYDGIHEADNNLPRWWLVTLWGTVAFAAVYYLHYSAFRSGLNPGDAYREEAKAAASAEAERIKAMGTITPEAMVTLSKDPATVALGKETFTTYCTACHGPNAGGTIGPNLTDEYWLHGGKPDQIYKTVRDGWPDKGMIAWAPSLGEQKVRAVAAYVLTLKNTNVAGGKAPQGEKEQ